MERLDRIDGLPEYSPLENELPEFTPLSQQTTDEVRRIGGIGKKPARKLASSALHDSIPEKRKRVDTLLTAVQATFSRLQMLRAQHHELQESLQLLRRFAALQKQVDETATLVEEHEETAGMQSTLQHIRQIATGLLGDLSFASEALQRLQVLANARPRRWLWLLPLILGFLLGLLTRKKFHKLR